MLSQGPAARNAAPIKLTKLGGCFLFLVCLALGGCFQAFACDSYEDCMKAAKTGVEFWVWERNSEGKGHVEYKTPQVDENKYGWVGTPIDKNESYLKAIAYKLDEIQKQQASIQTTQISIISGLVKELDEISKKLDK